MQGIFITLCFRIQVKVGALLIIRSENEIQPITEKANREVRRAPSFSGPLMLPNRASANSLSAPIKSSAGNQFFKFAFSIATTELVLSLVGKSYYIEYFSSNRIQRFFGGEVKGQSGANKRTVLSNI